MRAFHFRAQPALDLRRREHEAAQRVLARADAERQQAQARVHEAERTIAEARAAADAAARHTAIGPDRDWYRFWIIRLDRERQALQRALHVCDAALEAARTACMEARRRCEALERFREKALDAHRAAADAEERKAIDELATQRYALRQPREQGA